MPAPASLEALRRDTERRLRNYSILAIGCRWVVIRQLRWDTEQRERVFQTRDAAEAYLFAKLPPITDHFDPVRSPRHP